MIEELQQNPLAMWSIILTAFISGLAAFIKAKVPETAEFLTGEVQVALVGIGLLFIGRWTRIWIKKQPPEDLSGDKKSESN